MYHSIVCLYQSNLDNSDPAFVQINQKMLLMYRVN